MTIGVTGGMGAGKSSVCSLFAEWGAERIDADQVGHAALEDEAVQEALVSAFGPSILNSEGAIDRRSLGQSAFVSDESRKKLTDIVWPEVGRRLRAAVEDARGRCVEMLVIEASLLLERGDPEGLYEQVVVVTAPEEIRVRRSMERLGLTETEVRSRMRHQMSEEEKIKHADHVLVNDGDLETLEARTHNLWTSLTG